MGVIVFERLDAPIWLIFLTAVVFALVGVYLDRLLATFRRKIGLGALALGYVCVVSLTLLLLPSGFRLYYRNAPLDGQRIPLARSIDATRIQSQFYVNPNNPSVFTMTGISVKNVGNVAEEPQIVYFSFPMRITPVPSNDGWYPSSDQNPEGWTTFQGWFGLMSVRPGYSVSVQSFSGTPLPHEPTEAKVTVLYGSKEATAEFTILP